MGYEVYYYQEKYARVRMRARKHGTDTQEELWKIRLDTFHKCLYTIAYERAVY